jgi:hypothetical protein
MPAFAGMTKTLLASSYPTPYPFITLFPYDPFKNDPGQKMPKKALKRKSFFTLSTDSLVFICCFSIGYGCSGFGPFLA